MQNDHCRLESQHIIAGRLLPFSGADEYFFMIMYFQWHLLARASPSRQATKSAWYSCPLTNSCSASRKIVEPLDRVIFHRNRRPGPWPQQAFAIYHAEIVGNTYTFFMLIPTCNFLVVEAVAAAIDRWLQFTSQFARRHMAGKRETGSPGSPRQPRTRSPVDLAVSCPASSAS